MSERGLNLRTAPAGQLRTGSGSGGYSLLDFSGEGNTSTLSDMTLMGKSWTSASGSRQHLKRSPTEKLLQELARLAAAGGMSFDEVGTDLQIWKLVLLPRPARRRYLNFAILKLRKKLFEEGDGAGGALRRSSAVASVSTYDPDAAFRNMGGRGGRGTIRGGRDGIGGLPEGAGAGSEGQEDDELGLLRQRPGEGEGGDDVAAKGKKGRGHGEASDAGEEGAEAEAAAAAAAERGKSAEKAAEKAKYGAAAQKRGRNAEDGDADALGLAKVDGTGGVGVEPVDPFKLFRVKKLPSSTSASASASNLLPQGRREGSFGGATGRRGDHSEGLSEAASQAQDEAAAAEPKPRKSMKPSSMAGQLGHLAGEFRRAIDDAWSPYADETPRVRLAPLGGSSLLLGSAAAPTAQQAQEAQEEHQAQEAQQAEEAEASAAEPLRRASGVAASVLDGVAGAGGAVGGALGGGGGARPPWLDSAPSSPSSPMDDSYGDAGDAAGLDASGRALRCSLREQRARYRRKLQALGDTRARQDCRWGQRVEACRRSMTSLTALGGLGLEIQQGGTGWPGLRADLEVD